MQKDKKVIAGIVLAAAVIVAGFLLFGAMDQKPTGTEGGMTRTAPAENAVATTSVAIENFMFIPAAIRVKAGDTVTWTNKDSVQHNVVADTSGPHAPKGPLLKQNETYGFKFTKAGTYSYFCQPHPNMRATVIVTD
ncbi:MAG TPA: cupredoxin family copper-binding protein [Candidatus Saccharimonadales bacterium]|nr:cupredoxin family copper-binding protein [Candidatus Saccharimonadales bacterium]